VVCVHIFCFSFSEGKICLRNKQLVQDLIPLLSIYIHMCTLYTYTNICMPRFSPSGFFGPSRCLIPTPGLTTEYPICAVCVCVCVYTHIHLHTLPPALEIEKTQTTPLSFLLSKSSPPRQAIRKIHSLHSSLLIYQTTIVVLEINSSYIFFSNYYLTISKLL